MILYDPREGNRKWLKWNVKWKTKLNHFNLTLSRQFLHSLKELCCNTELGVISIALRIAYFDIFLIIKNIFKCGMKTQRFWEILCQTFLLIIFSQIISKWWSTWIDREHLPLSTQIVNSLVEYVRVWLKHTGDNSIPSSCSIEITNICYQVFILKLISCYLGIDSIKTLLTSFFC